MTDAPARRDERPFFDADAPRLAREAAGDAALLGLFTIIYGARVIHEAVTRPLWLDEFFTYYIATMPTLGEFWDALQRGPDANPPLFYLIERGTTGLLGETELALRLPSIVGYWLLEAALYIWARSLGARRPAASLLIAMPFLSETLYYASEARAYGLMLGTVGLALLCRRLVLAARWRRLALVGLGLSLSLTAALHYLGILATVVFWAAELWLWLNPFQRQGAQGRTAGDAGASARPRCDRPCWAALLSPPAVVAAHAPLFLRHAQLPFWRTVPEWDELLTFYRVLLSAPEMLALIGIAIGLTLIGRRQARLNPEPPLSSASRLWSAYGAAFFLWPAGWLALLRALDRAVFADRYLLSVIIGASLLTTLFIRQVRGPVAAIAAFGVWTLMATQSVAAVVQPWRLSLPSVDAFVALPDKSRPVVVDIWTFFQLRHYRGSDFPQVAHVAGFMNYPQPDDPTRGVVAVLSHPRASRFTQATEVFRPDAAFYVVCEKRLWSKVIIPQLRARGLAVVNETPEIIVFAHDGRRPERQGDSAASKPSSEP